MSILKTRNIRKLNLIYPLVLKPSNEGSSIGVKICKNYLELRKYSNELIKKYKTLLIENFIDKELIANGEISIFFLPHRELILFFEDPCLATQPKKRKKRK